jgi:hypothetical protein
MTNIYEELMARAAVLELIDRKRAETDDPTLGSAIERVIIDHCLAELERDASNPQIATRREVSLAKGRRFETCASASLGA